MRVVAFSPDGNVLASSTGNGDVILWETNTGKFIKRLDTESTVKEITFSSHGDILATNSGFWSVETGQIIQALEETNNSIAFSPDGSTVISGDENGILRLWRLSE